MEENGRHSEKLRRALEQGYNLDELRGLAFDLGIKFEQLDGTTLTPKVVALIDYACRHDKFAQLEARLRETRPQLATTWDEIDWNQICPAKLEDNLDETPPYQGLNYFDVSDTDRYFGRDALITSLMQRINDEKLNFLMIVGASGSGKSSLVRAGLIPTLQGNLNFAI